MNKPRLITIIAGIFLVAGIYFFGRTVPRKKNNPVQALTQTGGHEADENEITIDTILVLAKKQLNAGQVLRVNTLENAISRGNVKEQQISNYRQLSRFWADSVRIFEPYAWYLAEAARLENSEKSLTFAARLFLDNLQGDDQARRRKWKALQAKDLFERSLKINPANDSAKVGLGACYLFGNIAASPMEGILKIREVVDKDSTNTYAQMMLGKASLISGQYDKAIARFEVVCRLEPGNLDAILLLADVYERTGDKANAVTWYQKSLSLVKQPGAREAIEQRIQDLKK